MADGLILIHIHTQYANRRPKKVWRRLSPEVRRVHSNPQGITHQGNIMYNSKQLPVYLNGEGQWHGYPFGTDIEVTPIMW